MVGIASDESGVGRPLEGISSGQHRSQSGEALVEWRSSEQLEIGTPSTSPPYWDCDDEDEGPKPSELYGKYTWKIDKFSQINKRELRSNHFEVGGYKWYILIYPQGCDVCNHLSLFLCVAHHDKLLPGWSHFAQFTIAVVNKDPKKSKYSDTLHRFWKKEHDWGWKKFMELSKVLDGFIDADTLIIKAQVQVIRERPDRPFRCLDCSYRRELVRVYLTNVEQICRRFVEERRGKLGKLIEDKVRWTSFCAFWLGMDQSVRRSMSWEKMDLILKVVVKHFFIEKEVTSTLVMDSLYSGMKALEGQSEKSKSKRGDLEELPVPIVRVEKNMFVLVDDVLLLLERASLEPLPPKDEKGPQNRTKDGSSGEDFTKDSIERDERRLTELGRRTIEIFVLAHIFSKIEVAYQEAVSLKRQEELIREEEAAWLAESDQKARRGTVDKEKKSKKKQGKQKRNNRKTKDKCKDEKPVIVPAEHDIPNDERTNFFTEDLKEVTQKAVEEDVSDVSDSVDCTPKACHPDAGDQNVISGNWDINTSDLHAPLEASSSEISSPSAVQDGPGEMSVSGVDDSSSTCSTDSVPSVVVNGFNRGNTSYNKNQRSSNSRQQERSKSMVADWSNGYYSQPSETLSDGGNPISKAAFCSTEGQTKWSNQPELKKDEEVAPSRTMQSTKEARAVERLFSERTSTMTSPPASPIKIFSYMELKSVSNISNSGDSMSVGRHLSDNHKQAAESSQALHPDEVSVISRQGTCKPMIPDPFESRSALPDKPLPQHVSVSAGKPSTHHMPVSAGKPSKPQVAEMSRPLSTSLVPCSRPAPPVTSMVQTPLIPTTHSYASQSYRNVMMGNTVTVSSMGLSQPHSPNSGLNSSHGISQSPTLLSKPLFSSQSSERGEANANKASFSFGMVKQDLVSSGQHWIESPQRVDVTNVPHDHLSSNEIRNIDVYKQVQSRSTDLLSSDYAACTSGRVTHALVDDFPHIGIINDLLEDDAIGKVDSGFYTNSNGPQHFHRQFSFPGDIGLSNDMGPSSSCRLERALSYQDGLHHSYASQGVPYEALRDTMPHPNFRPYANGHINLMPNHWHMTGNEKPYLTTREMDNDSYTYHNPAEFLNMACVRPTFSEFHHSSNGN